MHVDSDCNQRQRQERLSNVKGVFFFSEHFLDTSCPVLAIRKGDHKHNNIASISSMAIRKSQNGKDLSQRSSILSETNVEIWLCQQIANLELLSMQFLKKKKKMLDYITYSQRVL